MPEFPPDCHKPQMKPDRTQRQSDAEQHRSQQLSMQPQDGPADLPGYELLRRLGSGAYGEVWVGIDSNTNRQVAVKFFNHQSGVDWQLLDKEVEKLVSLATARHVVQLLEVGWNHEPPYYVMEYLEQGSLDNYIESHSSLAVEDCLQVFEDVATGMGHAHVKGILHCDLKPANILLDEEGHARLADFGQSRLSTDQSPALGTLFYMAPEQADLNANPDVRWDIYGLGAILYTLLEGQPPYRNEQRLHEIDNAGNLEQRLATYQDALRSAEDPLADMRRSIDPALQSILSQCLAVDPDQRFASVADLLEALEQRRLARARRPLNILGLFGPLLLLAIMVLFSGIWYRQAVADAEQAVRERVYESNSWVSRHVALSVEEELRNYYQIIEFESSRPELQHHLRTVLQSELLESIQSNRQPFNQITAKQRAFFEQDIRVAFDDYLKQRIGVYSGRVESDESNPKLASLFVIGANGDMLSIAYDEPVRTQSVGRNYSFRTYFHGQGQDLNRDTKPQSVAPIQNTHLSAAFQSTTTKRWKIAISTPVYADDEQTNLLGIVALTLNLGDFSYLRSEEIENQFAVFIDGRTTTRNDQVQLQGTILQHPIMDELDNPTQEPFRMDGSQLQRLLQGEKQLYIDPVGQSTDDPLYKKYDGKWIAVIESVRLPGQASTDSGAPIESEVNRKQSELLILIQESYEDATSPIRELGSNLILEGIVTVVVLIIVVGTLWFFVLRRFATPKANQASSL